MLAKNILTREISYSHRTKKILVSRPSVQQRFLQRPEDKCRAFEPLQNGCLFDLPWLHAFFFYKNQYLSAQAGLFLIFWRFQPQIVLKLFFDFLIFLNSELAARNNTCKMALRNMFLKLSIQRSRTLTSLLITLPVPDGDDQANF